MPALSTTELQFVLDAMPSGALVVDQRGQVVRANLLALGLLGVDAASLPLPIESFVPEDARAGHVQLRSDYQAAPVQRRMGAGQELRARRADGAVFPAEVGLSPVNVDGEGLFLCSIVDLTPRQAMENQRAEARLHSLEVQRLESLALLASGVAHDFNNLLVAVLGNAQLAASADIPPLAAECLKDITAAAEQASELSRQLLAYSGHGRFTAERLDLSRVVLDARGLLRSLVRHRIDVRVHCAEGLPAVLADVGQLRQVLLNLVGNACDAMTADAGTVHITTSRLVTDVAYMQELLPNDRPAGTYVVLEVSDNGKGIERDRIAEIFEPFVSTKGGNRGMGLAAVRGIVGGHGAALTVYSEPGRGTTVKLLFPAIDGQTDDDAEPDSKERRGRYTILVADDNLMVRKFAKRALESLGYQVLLAEDGQEAVERFRSAAGGVDLVVVDLTMPRLDGSDTFRQLRSIDPEVKVVLTSGFSEHDVAAGLPSRGLVGFLQKPFTPEQLRKLVAEALDLDD